MSSRARHGSLGVGLGLCLCAAWGCDDKPEKKPSDSSTQPEKPAATATVTPKPAGPPDFEIDTLGAKVGFERALLDQRDGHDVLTKLLKPTENFVDGQDLSLIHI